MCAGVLGAGVLGLSARATRVGGVRTRAVGYAARLGRRGEAWGSLPARTGGSPTVGASGARIGVVRAGGGDGDGVGGGGGGGGGNGGDKGDGGGQGKGDGKDGDTKLVQALAKRGKLKDLPAYLVGAAEAGMVSNGDLKRIQAIAKLPAGLGRLLILSRPTLERALANPRFVFAMVVEVALSLGTRAARGVHDGEDEAPINLATGAVGDLAIVYFLSPLKSLGGRAAGAGSLGLAALPAFTFQVGAFTPAQRVAALAYKAVIFACIGAATAVMGHSLAMASSGGGSASSVSAADLAKEGGVRLAAVSNARYQIVSAIEERVCAGVPALGASHKSAIIVLRAANAFLGNSGVVRLPGP